MGDFVTCAADECSDWAKSTRQCSVRAEPIPVCDRHAEGALGFGAEFIFLVRPEYVEKKP